MEKQNDDGSSSVINDTNAFSMRNPKIMFVALVIGLMVFMMMAVGVVKLIIKNRESAPHRFENDVDDDDEEFTYEDDMLSTAATDAIGSRSPLKTSAGRYSSSEMVTLSEV